MTALSQLLLLQVLTVSAMVAGLQQHYPKPECDCFIRQPQRLSSLRQHYLQQQVGGELFCQNSHASPLPYPHQQQPLRGANFYCADYKLRAENFGIGAIEGQLLKTLAVSTHIQQVELTGNRLSLLTQAHFASVPNLRRLSLNRNAIRELNYHAFNGLHRLFYLDLDDNRLIEITPMTFGTTTVHSTGHRCNLRSLVYLYLANNQIEHIEPKSFECMTNLRELNLQKNIIKMLPDRAFFNLLSLNTLKLYDNQISEIHELAFTECCGLIRYLSLVDNRLSDLPHNTLKTMENLTSLYLDRNQFVHVPNYLLSTIDSHQRSASSKISDFHLQRNHIVQISRKDFQGAGKVESVNLFDNSIQRIEDYSFSSLSYTVNLVLQKNEIRSVTNRTFSGLVRLRYLILTDNRLEHIDDCAFSPLIRLDTLSLASNRLTGVRRLMFKNLNYTFSLNLASNYINQLQGDEFSLLPGLKYLYLEKNSLTHLRKNYFQGLAGLRKLDLSDNRIRTIDPLTFGKLDQLAFLDLSGNLLTSVCSYELHGLSSLHSLLLGKNQIASFDPDALDQLADSLNLLDLHDNRLTEFSTGYTKPGMSLVYLDLSSNRLILDDDCTFCGFDSVRHAHIGVATRSGDNGTSVDFRLNSARLPGLGGGGPSGLLDLTVNGVSSRNSWSGPCRPGAVSGCREVRASRIQTARNLACAGGGSGSSDVNSNGRSNGKSGHDGSHSGVTLSHVVLYVSIPVLLLLLAAAAIVLGFCVASRRKSALRRRQFQQRHIWEPDSNLLELNVEQSSSMSEMPKFSNKIYGNLL
ncbi:hypothetical protein BOX15_Mlig029906g2 [Macrostomum lignano]|uniref:LRRCT domain-containing protein n=1 Tax=Macrostomum lignano TaxID=282301 RepID=A0A267ED71_9PLAT|nr:hypothetical protein BOX15_Mlig029906g2 [Macrostomum lignano]